MKADERELLVAVAKAQRETAKDLDGGRVWPRQVYQRLGMPMKRACYLLGKWGWSSRDWYDYGTCIDLGWLTEKGLAAADSATAEGAGPMKETGPAP